MMLIKGFVLTLLIHVSLGNLLADKRDPFKEAILDTETTHTTTTPRPTTPAGCYPRNSEISRGRMGTWCWGQYCDANGQIIHWDDFQCSTTTRPPTSTTTRSPTSTTLGSGTGQLLRKLKELLQ